MMYKEGDTRVIEKFLLIPLTIDHEMRWFARVKIKQVYSEAFNYDDIGSFWEDVAWVD